MESSKEVQISDTASGCVSAWLWVIDHRAISPYKWTSIAYTFGFFDPACAVDTNGVALMALVCLACQIKVYFHLSDVPCYSSLQLIRPYACRSFTVFQPSLKSVLCLTFVSGKCSTVSGTDFCSLLQIQYLVCTLLLKEIVEMLKSSSLGAILVQTS